MRWSVRPEPRIRTICQRSAAPAVLLIALGLRLYRLGGANLWWDEGLAIWAVRKGLAGVTLWTAADVHPPLYFWSLWSWVQIAGESEFGMRLLSVVVGVLTVAAVYQLGMVVGGRYTALLGALLTALSRFHIWWSQEMRMYVLAGLLGVVSLTCFLRWLRAMQPQVPNAFPAHGRGLWAGYTLSTLGALYTIFLSGAWLLVQNTVVAGVLAGSANRARKGILWAWVLAQGTIAASVGLWLLLSWGRMRSWSVSEPVSFGFAARLYGVLLTSGASVDIDRYLWSLILPGVGLTVGLALLIRQALRDRDVQHRIALATLVLAVLVPPALIYLSTMPRSLFYTPHLEARYFLPFAPAFWVLLAWAVTAIGRRWRLAGLAVASALIFSWVAVLPGYYAGRYLKDDLQTMTRAIVSQSQPNDLVLLDSGSRYPLFLYQFERLPETQRPAFEVIDPTEDLLHRADVEAWLDRNASQYGRIWLAEVDAPITDPERIVRQVLGERYPVLWSEGYGADALYLYAPDEGNVSLRKTYIPAHPASPEAQALGLRGWELAVDTVTPEQPIWLALYWDRAPALPCTLEMRNARDAVVAARAVAMSPAQAPGRERIELPVSAATVPGPYDLRLSCDEAAPHFLRRITVRQTPNRPAPQGPEIALEALFADGIGLEGYTVVGAPDDGVMRVKPGEEIVLDLYWRALAAPRSAWTVFTHLTGEAYNPATQGPLWGQDDGVPAGGMWPTVRWRAGDRGVDRHIIIVDPQAPEGDYTLTFGLYEGASGARAAVSQAGQHLGDAVAVAVTLQVVRP